MDKAYYREMWEEAREELKLVDEENKDLRAENARLKAEVERLRASSFVTAVPVEQYERLRRAGDAMVQLLDHMDVVMDMDSDHPEVEAWNAAKGDGNTK